MSADTSKPAAKVTPSATDVATSLAALNAVLTESAEVVKGGQMVDLAGLDREVQQALDAVMALPAPEAKTLLPALDDLLVVLDRIAGDLEGVHGAVLPGTDSEANRRKAAAIYKKQGDEL